MLGMFRLRTEKQVREKIAQFRPGTRFALQDPRTSSQYMEARMKTIRKLLESVGMRVER